MQFYFRWPNRRSVSQAALWAVALANVVVIILFWRTGSAYYIENPDAGNLLFALGRLSGLLAQYCILVQLVLISRLPLVEKPYGFDRLNHVHRWNGYLLAITMIGHPLLLTISGAQSTGRSLLAQFADYLANRQYVLWSFYGLVLFLFVITISIAIVRKKVHYETWYLAHLLTYIAVGLIFFHQLHVADLKSGWPLMYWYYLNYIIFGIVLAYRFARPIIRWWWHGFRVEQVVAETKDVWSVYITGRRMSEFRYQAGQYANLRFLDSRRWWQSHPFSFSTAMQLTSIRFSMKGSGDYTKILSTLRPGTPVIVDGPLGQFVLSRSERKQLLFIAGGIGITPLRSLLEEVVHHGGDAVLLYANRTSADIALRTELEALAAVGHVRIHHILGQPEPGYETGFIDREKIVRLVPDFYQREVFLCGPPPMMTAVVNQLKGLGLSDEHIHFEKFSF